MVLPSRAPSVRMDAEVLRHLTAKSLKGQLSALRLVCTRISQSDADEKVEAWRDQTLTGAILDTGEHALAQGRAAAAVWLHVLAALWSLSSEPSNRADMWSTSRVRELLASGAETQEPSPSVSSACTTPRRSVAAQARARAHADGTTPRRSVVKAAGAAQPPWVPWPTRRGTTGPTEPAPKARLKKSLRRSAVKVAGAAPPPRVPPADPCPTRRGTTEPTKPAPKTRLRKSPRSRQLRPSVLEVTSLPMARMSEPRLSEIAEAEKEGCEATLRARMISARLCALGAFKCLAAAPANQEAMWAHEGARRALLACAEDEACIEMRAEALATLAVLAQAVGNRVPMWSEHRLRGAIVRDCAEPVEPSSRARTSLARDLQATRGTASPAVHAALQHAALDVLGCLSAAAPNQEPMWQDAALVERLLACAGARQRAAVWAKALRVLRNLARAAETGPSMWSNARLRQELLAAAETNEPDLLDARKQAVMALRNLTSSRAVQVPMWEDITTRSLLMALAESNEHDLCLGAIGALQNLAAAPANQVPMWQCCHLQGLALSKLRIDSPMDVRIKAVDMLINLSAAPSNQKPMLCNRELLDLLIESIEDSWASGDALREKCFALLLNFTSSSANCSALGSDDQLLDVLLLAAGFGNLRTQCQALALILKLATSKTLLRRVWCNQARDALIDKALAQDHDGTQELGRRALALGLLNRLSAEARNQAEMWQDPRLRLALVLGARPAKVPEASTLEARIAAMDAIRNLATPLENAELMWKDCDVREVVTLGMEAEEPTEIELRILSVCAFRSIARHAAKRGVCVWRDAALWDGLLSVFRLRVWQPRERSAVPDATDLPSCLPPGIPMNVALRILERAHGMEVPDGQLTYDDVHDYLRIDLGMLPEELTDAQLSDLLFALDPDDAGVVEGRALADAVDAVEQWAWLEEDVSEAGTECTAYGDFACTSDAERRLRDEVIGCIADIYRTPAVRHQVRVDRCVPKEIRHLVPQSRCLAPPRPTTRARPLPVTASTRCARGDHARPAFRPGGVQSVRGLVAKAAGRLSPKAARRQMKRPEEGIAPSGLLLAKHAARQAIVEGAPVHLEVTLQGIVDWWRPCDVTEPIVSCVATVGRGHRKALRQYVIAEVFGVFDGTCTLSDPFCVAHFELHDVICFEIFTRPHSTDGDEPQLIGRGYMPGVQALMHGFEHEIGIKTCTGDAPEGGIRLRLEVRLV